jgi:hypothetical protein
MTPPASHRPAWGWDPPTIFFVAVLILGLAAFTTPEFDPDFWWTARIGLEILARGAVPLHNYFTFTATSRPFISQEWGSEVIDAWLYTHLGMTAVIMTFAVATWVGFFLGVIRVDRAGQSRWVLAVGAALVLISGLQIWGPSPQMFSFGLLGILLTLLDAYRRRPRRWLLVGLVPLFVIWGNLHGGFLIGLGVVLVFLVGEWLETYLRHPLAIGYPACRELLLAWLLAVLAPMLNPNGTGIYLYPAKLLLSHVAQASLNEWQPPDFHSPATIPTLFLLLTTLLTARWAGRTRLSDLLLAAAGVVLMLYAVRDIPIFAVLVLPLWADGVQGFSTHLGRSRGVKRARRRPAPAWFVASVLVMVALAAGARMLDQLHSPENELISSAYPVAVGQAICQGPAARVLAPYGSSGWLLYRIDHRVAVGRSCAPDRVFIFGEVVLMGRTVLSDYLTAVAGGGGSLAVLRRYRVSLVWQPRGAPLTTLLLRTHGWRCVFATSSNVLMATSATAPDWHSSRADCPS